MSVQDATSMIAVSDIDAACAFMRDCLGFETTHRSPGHAYCKRGGGAVRFLQAPKDADMDDPARQTTVYIDVEDTDAEFETYRGALEKLPKGKMRPPFDQPYGQREFHAIHEAILIMVGQRITKEA